MASVNSEVFLFVWYHKYMNLKVNAFSAFISVLIGSIVGYFGGPVFVLVIWAAIGLTIGAYSVSRRASILNGALFGFAVSYSFMISGYAGKDTLASRLIPFMVLGIFGALCGLTLGLLGNKFLIRHK